MDQRVWPPYASALFVKMFVHREKHEHHDGVQKREPPTAGPLYNLNTTVLYNRSVQPFCTQPFCTQPFCTTVLYNRSVQYNLSVQPFCRNNRCVQQFCTLPPVA
jgi:hypothetical protein